ncbi:unnamed protein product [Linum trigynum]|uniref:Uncharacterized protein n=1 Tax=Linum trigynum TaxID=586398 RepID=A0AAV2CHY7_9ROSI
MPSRRRAPLSSGRCAHVAVRFFSPIGDHLIPTAVGAPLSFGHSCRCRILLFDGFPPLPDPATSLLLPDSSFGAEEGYKGGTRF